MSILEPALVQARRRTRASGPKAPRPTQRKANAALETLKQSMRARQSGMPSAILSARSGVYQDGQRLSARRDAKNRRVHNAGGGPRPMRTHEVSHRPKARMVSDVRRLPSGLAFSAAPRQREVVVGSDMRIRPVVRQVSAVEESRIGRYNRGAGADYYQEVIETQPLAEVVRVGVQARDLFESSRPGVSLRQMTLAQARQKAGGILTSEMPVSQPTRTAARLAAQDQTPAYKAAEVQAAEAIDKAHGSPPTQPSKLRKYGPWVLLGLVVAGIMSR